MDPEASRVHRLARERPALPGGGRLVCIDGPAGSGKTTLASALTSVLGDSVSVVHLDDVYDGWRGLGDDLAERLLRGIVSPYAVGSPGSYRRYDWELGAFAERHTVPPTDWLILEGVGSGHRLLAEHRTLLVWVSAPDDLRVERGLARDRELYGATDALWDETAQRAHWGQFLADEARHFAENDLPAAADVHIDGTRPAT